MQHLNISIIEKNIKISYKLSAFQFGPDFQVNGAVKKAFDETGFIVIK